MVLCLLDIQGYKIMIEKIKKDLIDTGKKSIYIKVNNIRNKSEVIRCKIKEMYERHFIVETDDLINRSFSYADILTGNIELQGKKY